MQSRFTTHTVWDIHRYLPHLYKYFPHFLHRPCVCINCHIGSLYRLINNVAVYTDSLIPVQEGSLYWLINNVHIGSLYRLINNVAVYTDSLIYAWWHGHTAVTVWLMYSQLHLKRDSISISNLNLIGLFSTERGKRVPDDRLKFETGKTTLQIQ